MPANPMDKMKRILDKDTGTGLFQYFIKIIPTAYKSSFSGATTLTNQYTVSEKFKPLQSKDENGQLVQMTLLPGIFFIFEISPFQIQVTNSAIPFYHLLTRLFAIVGGIFTILGIFDAILFRVQKISSKKN
jgi:hypothetical protein